VTPDGEPFGPYVKVALLGRGGFGEVWRAWEPALSRWVALKILASDENVDRFAREARVGATLEHPGLAAVYDVGRCDGRAYIAMQLVDGRSTSADPPRGARRSAEVVRDAARAVAAAHAHGIVHRDLKPDNLMVDGARRVFVLDFGLARPVRAGGTLTLSGEVVGTPAYMSPEQARGERADERTDVYALGATLYEFIAGRRVFEGRDIVQVLTDVVDKEPPPLDGAPRELEAIVMKCLSKDRTRRYATATALADDLTRWLDGARVSARATGGVLRAARRWRLAAAIAGIALAASAVTVAVLLPRMRQREDELARRARMQRLAAAIEDGRGYFYVRGGDIRDKLRRVEAAVAELEAMPARAGEAWLLTGMGLYLLGRGDEAERALREAERLGCADPRLDYLLGRQCVEASMLAGMKQVTDDFGNLSVLPARNALREAEERLRRAADRLGEGAIERDVAAVYELFAAGRPAEADERCRIGLARFGDAAGTEDYWLVRAISKNDPGERIRLYDEALRVRPHYPVGLLARGASRLNGGDRAGALADFDACLAIWPRWWLGLYNRGTVRTHAGDFAGALADLTAAYEVDRTRPEALVNRAGVFRLQGRLAEAELDLQRALADDPRLAQAHWVLADVRVAAGDAAGAERCVDEVVRLVPTAAHPRARRGGLRYDRGDYPGALEDLRMAIRMDPRHALAHGALGDTLRQLRDPAGALAAYDEAVRLGLDAPEVLFNRGALRGMKGDYRGAVEDFDRVLRTAPSDWPHRTAVEQMRRHALARLEDK
jgi:tetratricopeptide (TPR) repeat protein